MKKIIIALSILALSATGQTPKHCAGTTKKGEPCKSTFIIKGTEYCRFHSPTGIHCDYIKKDGTKCKNVVKEQGQSCHTHFFQVVPVKEAQRRREVAK